MRSACMNSLWQWIPFQPPFPPHPPVVPPCHPLQPQQWEVVRAALPPRNLGAVVAFRDAVMQYGGGHKVREGGHGGPSWGGGLVMVAARGGGGEGWGMCDWGRGCRVGGCVTGEGQGSGMNRNRCTSAPSIPHVPTPTPHCQPSTPTFPAAARGRGPWPDIHHDADVRHPWVGVAVAGHGRAVRAVGGLCAHRAHLNCG